MASLHQGSPASGVLRGVVARLFLCSNGLLRTCLDRNRTNLIGIALYGVAAKTRVSWRTGCAIIARSTAPAMVSCERPSPNPVTTPANGEGVPRSLPEAGLHERGRALARTVRRGDRVHDEAAANGSLNGTTPKSDSRIVHEETCGNCCCCRSSIAHRLERGDACICSSIKGARYCQKEVAFLRSPRGGRPRRKVRRAHVRAGRCGRFLRNRKRWSGTSPTQRNRSHRLRGLISIP